MNSPTTKLAMTTAEIVQNAANDLTAIAEIVADAHHAAEVAAVAEAAVVAEAVAADAVAVAAAEVVEAAAVEVAAVADAKAPFRE